ncbi:hypothetical protein BJ508DRAFT_371756 [Ascobolus immersus RN42]|uniref:Uncharacterized protein n=1 Tax=Ascobolus immersus RN42 TaxID=1160509 RepID=A0A3N4IRQ3_ASCIM|nr:hypothetical protein BJ508DRAFT_371756 [Ascobolus immersus RN42]
MATHCEVYRARNTIAPAAHPEALILSYGEDDGPRSSYATTLYFQSQKNLERKDCSADEQLESIMDAVGRLEVTYHDCRTNVIGSFVRLGCGISISAAHVYEIGQELASMLDRMCAEDASGFLTSTKGIHGFDGAVGQDVWVPPSVRHPEYQIGYDLSFLAAPAMPSVLSRGTVAAKDDVCLLVDAGDNQQLDEGYAELEPGVLQPDGVVKLVTVNGFPRSIEKMLKPYEAHGKRLDVDKLGTWKRIEELLPCRISVVEGTAVVAGEGGCGALLNSKNQLIGIHCGAFVGPNGEPIGTTNVGVNLNTPEMKQFLLANLVPRFPEGSSRREKWTAFCNTASA